MGRRMAGAWVGAALLLASCGSGATPAIERSAAAPDSESIAESDAPATPPTTADASPTSTSTPPAGPARQIDTSPAAPRPAEGPRELASRIAAAETLVRDDTTPAPQVAAAAFELQVLYRQLGRRTDWETQVLAALPASLRFPAWANASARREFRDMARRLSDTLPAWRIVDPAPADELLAYYREGQATFGVPWEVLAAVNLVETGMGRIRGTSVAGAQGPMQFMPATWELFGAGGDINDPHDAILAAARYLAHNGGGSGDLDNALWNYNHDHRYVNGVKYYASIMADDPRTFRAFYNWQIVFLSELGDIWLPTGYEQADRVAVADYVATHPGHRLGTRT